MDFHGTLWNRLKEPYLFYLLKPPISGFESFILDSRIIHNLSVLLFQGQEVWLRIHDGQFWSICLWKPLLTRFKHFNSSLKGAFCSKSQFLKYSDIPSIKRSHYCNRKVFKVAQSSSYHLSGSLAFILSPSTITQRPQRCQKGLLRIVSKTWANIVVNIGLPSATSLLSLTLLF